MTADLAMTLRTPLSTARHIVVEGPIGVGKTPLARRLAEYLGADLLLDQPETNPFLARFHGNRPRYALPTQLAFMLQRLEQQQRLKPPDEWPRALICDYLPEKDALFASLTLDEDEFALYRQIHARLAAAWAATPSRPDLVIYLQARAETLTARLRQSEADFERRFGEEYLGQLIDGYTRFFHHYEAAPVMVVNSDNLDFIDNDEDFKMLVQRIEAMRGHREYFNRGN